MSAQSGLITVLERAVRKTGPRLRRDFGEVQHLQVSRKGPADFVSLADKRAEETLVEELRKARPDWGMLLEEGGEIAGDPTKPRWIVDPLDGTTNFLHGLPHWAVSIALEHKGEIVAGVIFDAAKDELYHAEKGNGAWMNGNRLRVSGRRQMIESVFATGVPFASQPYLPATLKDLARLMPAVAGVRRFGAASLDLAYVAAGRFDGYWERGIKAWDVAAGIVLVKEAGGFAEAIRGEGPVADAGNIVCANPQLFPELASIVRNWE